MHYQAIERTQAPTVANLHWAAGFLEGEGSFVSNIRKDSGGRRVRVQANQVQKEPLLRLQQWFGGSITSNLRISAWALCSDRAAALMMTLYPLMSPRRQGQIRASLTAWKTIRKMAIRTHCPQGHPYDEANTVREGNHRICRNCRNARARQRNG